MGKAKRVLLAYKEDDMSYEIFRNLEGKWSINRNIKGIGYGKGRASFTKSTDDQNVLCYSERLDLHLGENQHYSNAHQEYKFIYDPERMCLEKYTSAESLMYRLEITGKKARGLYLCSPDKYIATYDFIDDNLFTLTYFVSGPRKDYIIVTEFEKIEEDMQDTSGASSNTVDVD